jgi:hypothetical protein
MRWFAVRRPEWSARARGAGLEGLAFAGIIQRLDSKVAAGIMIHAHGHKTARPAVRRLGIAGRFQIVGFATTRQDDLWHAPTQGSGVSREESVDDGIPEPGSELLPTLFPATSAVGLSI